MASVPATASCSMPTPPPSLPRSSPGFARDAVALTARALCGRFGPVRVPVRVRADAPHRFVENDLVVDPGVLAAGAQLGERVQVDPACRIRLHDVVGQPGDLL